ncbi:MAG: alpha/beta hydrolase [Gemmatimonadota bacterium]
MILFGVRLYVASLLVTAVSAGAQPGLDRTRNNIQYPNGYTAATDENAGRIEKVGTGGTTLVFIGGWGFSADVFRDFATANAREYTTYLVTLPGFGGTPGWPMPGDSVSHATTPWITRSAAYVARALANRNVHDAIVLGHFLIGTHVAMALGQHDERIRGIVLLGGELSRYWPSREDTTGRTPATPEQRAASVDRAWVPRFFRYVTDSTWHANNYLAHTFSVDSARAAPLWSEQASVPLPIMIRYLSDFYATEFAPKLDSVRVPALVLQPGFSDAVLSDKRTPYLKPFFQDSWTPARARGNFTIRTVPNAAVNIWLDQPVAFQKELREFVARLRTR